MTAELKQAETELALVESQLKIEEAKVRTAIIKKTAKPLLEGWDHVPHAVDGFSTSDPHFFADGFPHRHTPWTLRSDREDGKFFPLYETEQDLARIRGQSRNLAAFTSTTIGAVDALKNYVYGTGFTYTIQAKEGVEADEFVKQAQRVIDEFIELNDYTGVIDVESHQRSREDGEVFVHLQADGPRVFVDIIEPDNVTEPKNKLEMEKWIEAVHGIDTMAFVPSWKFGILTSQRQTWRPLGYHVIFDSAGNDWEFIPAKRMVHIRRNIPRKAKRGVSDFVPVWDDIEAEARLRKNTVEGATLQAAIVFIREHVPGISKDDITDYVAANATTNYEKSIKDGTRTVQFEKFQSGTVKDIPAGMKYHAGPLGTLRSPVYIEVAQFVLRSIGQRWSMPEFIVSGDSSNANFSSTMMAESPFVKARECDQQFYKRHDMQLLWKVLRLAWENDALSGATWQQVRQSIEIKIDAPEVASRDKFQQAQANEILQRMGAKSLRTIAAEHELDFDEEKQNMEQDGDPQPGEGEQQPLTEAARFPGLSLIEGSAGCGTGEGGFGSGNKCAKDGGSSNASKKTKKHIRQLFNDIPIKATTPEQVEKKDRLIQELGDMSDEVLGNIPERISAKLQDNVKVVIAGVSDETLTNQIISPIQEKLGISLKPGEVTAGAYLTGSSTLALGSSGDLKKRRDVFAHEITHALDGPNKEISSSKEWQSAWKAEIKDRPGTLSRYATISPEEGLAEVGRFIYGKGIKKDVLAKRMPKVTKVLEEKGLL